MKMKNWKIAAFLAIMPISGWVGLHHAYLDNNRKVIGQITFLSVVFGYSIDQPHPEGIQYLGILTLVLTIYCFYDAYCYIRFGLIPNTFGVVDKYRVSHRSRPKFDISEPAHWPTSHLRKE